MTIFRRLLTLIALACTTIPLQAEVYRWVDSQGNVEFSDQPRQGAEKIEVPETATISLPKPEDVPRDTPEPEPFRYDTLSISFPANDSAFFSGNGNFTATVALAPGLRGAHSVRLLFDGAVHATDKATSFNFQNVNRGTHTLKAEIVTDSGAVFQSSDEISFTIHRPSAIGG